MDIARVYEYCNRNCERPILRMLAGKKKDAAI